MYKKKLIKYEVIGKKNTENRYNNRGQKSAAAMENNIIYIYSHVLFTLILFRFIPTSQNRYVFYNY